MTMPDILSVEHPMPDAALLTFELSAECPAFAGHFPGQPILPGVAQLDWAMRFSGQYLALTQRVARDFQLKFRRVLRPGDRVSLLLRHDRPKGRLFFEYRLGDEVASTGRVSVVASP